MQTLEQAVAAATFGPRLSAILFAVFAGVALTLAALGIYGVMSQAVSARTPGGGAPDDRASQRAHHQHELPGWRDRAPRRTDLLHDESGDKPSDPLPGSTLGAVVVCWPSKDDPGQWRLR